MIGGTWETISLSDPDHYYASSEALESSSEPHLRTIIIALSFFTDILLAVDIC